MEQLQNSEFDLEIEGNEDEFAKERPFNATTNVYVNNDVME